MRSVRVLLCVALAAAAALAIAGCRPTGAEVPKVTPKVKPPAIREAGVLRVGVDESYPPFSSKVDGKFVGMDVDVASALADKLGLRLQLVGVESSQVASALEQGAVDLSLGALPITDAVLTDVAFVGSYAMDGPALFSANETTIMPADLAFRKVGTQAGSAAWWQLESELGPGTAATFPTLRAALEAMGRSEVDVVAADGIVGAYLVRDFPGVRFAGWLADPAPLGVVTGKDAPELETAAREALDELAADGVLDAVRDKWASLLPQPATASEATTAP